MANSLPPVFVGFYVAGDNEDRLNMTTRGSLRRRVSYTQEAAIALRDAIQLILSKRNINLSYPYEHIA